MTTTANADKPTGSEELGTAVLDLLPVGAESDIVQYVQTEGRTWAIRPEMLSTLSQVHGTLVSTEAVERYGATNGRSRSRGNGVAVISINGMITPDGGLLAMLFGGGGGLSSFRQEFQRAMADKEVKAIVLNIDSPGGLVDQVPEVAGEIRDARDSGTKPIVAVANTLAASAAYWLASQAHEVVVSPSGEVGSIGVYQLHKDMSKALDTVGIKPTLISAGKYKVEGNPYEPLSDEARTAAQQGVNDYYDLFTADVGAGRGASQDEVQAGFGEGRTMTAKRAKSAGLADRVATLDQTVSRLSTGRAKVRGMEAESFSTEGTSEGSDSSVVRVIYTPEERVRMVSTLARPR